VAARHPLSHHSTIIPRVLESNQVHPSREVRDHQGMGEGYIAAPDTVDMQQCTDGVGEEYPEDRPRHTTHISCRSEGEVR
jgi:hypothetical protein